MPWATGLPFRRQDLGEDDEEEWEDLDNKAFVNLFRCKLFVVLPEVEEVELEDDLGMADMEDKEACKASELTHAAHVPASYKPKPINLKHPSGPILFEPCRQDVALPARKKRCGRPSGLKTRVDVARQGGREALGWSWSTRRRWTQGACLAVRVDELP